MSSQTGKFEAIRTVSKMVHSAYYLPDDGKTWVGGDGMVYSSNAAQMTCTTRATACGGATRTLNGIYDRESTYYGYLYHDFTQEIRAGLETNWTRTSYADGSNARLVDAYKSCATYSLRRAPRLLCLGPTERVDDALYLLRRTPSLGGFCTSWSTGH